MGFVRRVTKGFFNIYLHLLYRYEITGLENLPKEGGAVLCSNHIHAYDSLSYAIYIKRNDIYAMAKQEFFDKKLSGWFMGSCGCFPVKRGSGASIEAIDTAVNYLKNGNLVLIFPEGTRNGLQKGVKPKKGISLVALKGQAPVIPMGIEGNFEKPFSKITINIGKPMDFSEYYGQEDNPRNLITITNKIMDEIKSLAGIEG